MVFGLIKGPWTKQDLLLPPLDTINIEPFISKVNEIKALCVNKIMLRNINALQMLKNG
jgi:hypothetical protein